MHARNTRGHINTYEYIYTHTDTQRRTDRQTDRHTHTHTHTHTYTYTYIHTYIFAPHISCITAHNLLLYDWTNRVHITLASIGKPD